MAKLVLIDAHALIHRAFHALPPLSAPDGRQTNAVYGFTSVLLKMMNDLKPEYIAAAFDLAGGTFRHEEYKEYKATRKKAPDELYAQIPIIKDMLGAMGIPIYEKQGFEADDIIGTIAAKTQPIPDLQTVIVTGDLDTLQLVHEKKVVVFTLRKGMTDTVTYDEQAVFDRYGLVPEQIPDFKGLKGDPSDNIPGVKGIGEKTAATLIQEYGTVEALYEKLKTKTRRIKTISEKLEEKLMTGEESARFSKKLATIVRDVPIEFDLGQTHWQSRLDIPATEKLCRDLGFHSLVKRVSVTLGAVATASAAATLDFDGTASVLPTLRVIGNPADLPTTTAIALHAVIEEGVMRELFCAAEESVVFRIPTPTTQHLTDIFNRYPTVIGHGLKSLVKNISASPVGLFDTEIAAWLVNPTLRDYGLERIAYDFSEYTLPPDPSTWPAALLRLKPILESRMKELDLQSLFTDMEMPLIAVLAVMERRGILIDTTCLSELAIEADREVASLEKKIHKLAGEPFNINSPAQLGEVLFNKLALRGRVRRTAGGALSTAADELEKLRDEHPIIPLVLEYRELNKLKTTYIDPFPSLIAADGRIHTTYNQTGTATGRLSSSDPNLQNIPTRTELGTRFRSAFIAPPGWKLLSLDYSQLELRLVAHIAHDETMIEAFRRGEDIHTRTASEIFGVAPIQVTKDMRRQAKVLNFGIIYGMGSLGFARAAGVDRTTAKHFIDEYFQRFRGVAEYMERTKEEAYKNGFVTTLLGRRRPLTDITSTMPQLQAAAERMAINHPIQGTGADFMKLAMTKIEHHLATAGLDDRIRMLLQVHDELVFEVREDMMEQALRDLPPLMQGVASLEVPLMVDAKTGPNWAVLETPSHENS